MAEPALALRDHPQIIDLISVLEQSGLQKAEGRSAGPGGLYRRYGRKAGADDGRNERNASGGGQAHDKGIRARCSQLVDTVEGKVHQTKVMVSTAKENLISSAKQMVQTFQEKGAPPCAMRPRPCVFPRFFPGWDGALPMRKKSMGQLAVRLDAMREELHQAGGHIKNAGLVPLRGRNPRKARNYLRIRVCLPSCGALCCTAARHFLRWIVTRLSLWSESMAGAHR